MGTLASGLGLGEQQAALGILRVVNANMERAIRAISLERGYDPRSFTLVPFGGAGPVHGCELAQELGIPRVLIPARPGILSALGVAIADVVKDYSRTVMLRGADLDRERLEEEFHGMEGLARAELEQEGLPSDRMTARRFLDVRYVGQSFELNVDYPTSRGARTSEGLARAISDSFYRAHLQRFGYADRAEPVEIVNLRLKLDLAVDKPDLQLDSAQWIRDRTGRGREGGRGLQGRRDCRRTSVRPGPAVRRRPDRRARPRGATGHHDCRAARLAGRRRRLRQPAADHGVVQLWIS